MADWSATEDVAIRFRNRVNDSDIYAMLEPKPEKWRQIRAATEVLDDAGMAVRAHILGPDTGDKGEQHFRIYGLLQCFTVQHDAVKLIVDALKLKTETIEKTREIRQIQNAVIGHPNLKNSGTPRGSFGIVQHSMTSAGFEWTPFSPTTRQQGNEPRARSQQALQKHKKR